MVIGGHWSMLVSNMKRILSPISIAFFLLFCLLIYFPLFLHLDQLSLRLWDESRRAVNAFEMVQNGNWLVTHYDGQPEMWGTKPPLLIWCQAIAMKLLGFKELAVRIPSALAALATVFLLILFCSKFLKRPLVGFFAGMVLVTTRGYISAHGARSGDFDALLALWELGYLFSFYLFLDAGDSSHKRKWIYLAALFITLAGMTKGVAGFLFLPGLILFAIWQKQFKKLLTYKHCLIAAAGVLLVILGFYLLRELNNPGYLGTVWRNEIGGRYLKALGGHLHPWFFYFKMLYKERYLPWLFFLPLGLLSGWLAGGNLKKFTNFIFLTCLVFLLILSLSKTKIVWYMLPVYPLFSLIVGIGLERLVSQIRTIGSHGNRNYSPFFLAAFVVAVFALPYQKTIERIYFQKHPPWDWAVLKYRDFMKMVGDEKTYTIVHSRYNSHVVFYKNTYNLKGYQIDSQPLIDFQHNKYEFGKGPLAFDKGALLVICEKKVFQSLNEIYRYEVLREWDSCKLVKIKGEL